MRHFRLNSDPDAKYRLKQQDIGGLNANFESNYVVKRLVTAIDDQMAMSNLQSPEYAGKHQFPSSQTKQNFATYEQICFDPENATPDSQLFSKKHGKIVNESSLFASEVQDADYNLDDIGVDFENCLEEQDDAEDNLPVSARAPHLSTHHNLDQD